MGSLEDQTQESIPPAMGKQMFEAYRRMLVSLFIAALLVIAVIAALGFAMDIAAADGSEDGYQPPITLAVALAGVVGALFSALTRLYDVRDLPKALIHPELRHLGNKYLLMYSLVPVVMGLVASVVVYLAVLGGALLMAHCFPISHALPVRGNAILLWDCSIMDQRRQRTMRKRLCWASYPVSRNV